MKKIVKIILWAILVLVILFSGFLAFITATDYRPAQVISLLQENVGVADTLSSDTLRLISWNIGYAGLGKEMDFFYDGGKRVRPEPEMTRKYLDGIKDFIRRNDSVDCWLLQEIDKKAHRSYKINEVEEITQAAGAKSSVFAVNYSVPFVPVPIYEPMGYVEGGMLSFSAFSPSEATRYAYPLIASWPDRLFLLDRCFILTRFPLADGRDLVVINTHNSAYVYDSLLMVQELEVIKSKMLEEYGAGNYVVAGGDWNANPPVFVPEGDYNGHHYVDAQVKMSPKTMPAEWVWAVDASAPTNRNNDQLYVKGENGSTQLDYFLVSTNVQVIQVKTIDLGFENSDHNPVYLKINLKK
jgi:endonuclease/exonuclease/phosphatase family metal-dependent hydrolase